MSSLPVRDPRTGRSRPDLPLASPQERAELLDRLRIAQPGWADAGPTARATALLAWADALKQHREQLIAGLIADTGRRTESEIEVDSVVAMARRWAEAAPDMLAPESPRRAAIPTVTIEQEWSPRGLIGVISPWNYPLLLSLVDAIPALAAGCAVVIKPSEVTSQFVQPLLDATGLVPAVDAVMGVAVGAGDVGTELIGAVDAVCFTGSVPTGRKVALAAAEHLIPAFLELGGKDPAIVCAGADLGRAAAAILWGSTAGTGQSCQSIERVYVQDVVHADLVERIVALAEHVQPAWPNMDDGQLGPIIAERQVATITRHLDDAVAKGARVRSGGQVHRTAGGGAFLGPTVLTGVDHSMLVMTEETFGPIIPIMSVVSIDQAVTLANATEYGLSAAVFAPPEMARDVATRLLAGAVSINDAALTAVVHDAEKEAFKSSGLGGTRMGPRALHRFLRRRAYLIADPAIPNPWWYTTPTL